MERWNKSYSLEHRRNISTFLERKNNMSFNCVYMNNNIAYVGADSRQTFSNGEYNDSFQKVFVNKELKMIWSMTGLISYKGFNYVKLVSYILNKPDINIIDKLETIKIILNAVTKWQYQDNDLSKDSIFDLFVLTLENGKLKYYIFESKNGYTPSYGQQLHTDNHSESSGVHTEMKDNISPYQVNHLSEVEMVHEIYQLIQNVKIESQTTDNSVGGDIHIATMDINGNIKTYVNGEEANFKIM